MAAPVFAFAAEADDSTVAELVVTAQKREQRLLARQLGAAVDRERVGGRVLLVGAVGAVEDVVGRDVEEVRAGRLGGDVGPGVGIGVLPPPRLLDPLEVVTDRGQTDRIVQ